MNDTEFWDNGCGLCGGRNTITESNNKEVCARIRCNDCGGAFDWDNGWRKEKVSEKRSFSDVKKRVEGLE